MVGGGWVLEFLVAPFEPQNQGGNTHGILIYTPP
jgi:hypothetical protein